MNNYDQEAQRLAMEFFRELEQEYGFEFDSMEDSTLLCKKLNLPQLLADSARVKELEDRNAELTAELDNISSAYEAVAKSACKAEDELQLARKCVEALRIISGQRPEKPDHYTTCGQCDRNIDEAKEAIAEYDKHKRTQKEQP